MDVSRALAVANDQRRAGAAEATTAAVRAALLRAGNAAPEKLALVGLLRVAHPTASLRELGEHAGLSKDTVAARLRRLVLFDPDRPRRYTRAEGAPVRTLRYTDVRGRQQILTWVQWLYLDTVDQRGAFERGWGGLASTLTVRLLRERGLIELDDRREPWRVTGLKQLGRSVLAEWRKHA